ncbi:MAG: 30S ribosomal protein S6 [Planctomycetota bacterium]
MKTETKKKLYEAMFLVDSGDAGSDWDGILAAIKKILKKAKAEVVSMRKWDDRRLAYEIKGKGRGTYILCYFRSDGQKNPDIEKGVQLSERIMRVLILSVDWMTTEDIEKDTPATKVEKEKEQRQSAKEESEQAKAAEQSAEQEAQAVEEPAPAEAAAITEEASTTEAVEATEEPAIEEATEPAEAETDDAQESEPKVTADE